MNVAEDVEENMVDAEEVSTVGTVATLAPVATMVVAHMVVAVENPGNSGNSGSYDSGSYGGSSGLYAGNKPRGGQNNLAQINPVDTYGRVLRCFECTYYLA